MNFDTKENIVKNYLERDVTMGLNDQEQIISFGIFKLGYHPDVISNNTLNGYKAYCNELLEKERKSNFLNKFPRMEYQIIN